VLRKGFVPAIEVNSLDTAKRIARQSDALFPGSASMLATELSSDNLFMLDYDSPTLRSQPALVRLRNRTLSPAALRFVELVRAVESELVAAEGTEHDVE
jgi:DNA-binding transcriptional LysR family regulator